MNNRNLFIIVLEAVKSKIKVSTFNLDSTVPFWTKPKKNSYKTLYTDPTLPQIRWALYHLHITQYTNIWRIFIQILVLFPRTLGGLTHHSCEHKERTCWGQIPTVTPTRRDFLRQQFFFIATNVNIRTVSLPKENE